MLRFDVRVSLRRGRLLSHYPLPIDHCISEETSIKKHLSLLSALLASVFLFVSCGGGGDKSAAVTGVTLNKAALTLSVGSSETLLATIAPENASNKAVVWSSSNPSVASVTSGRVTANEPGAANIIVATHDGNKTASCAVTVPLPIAISISPEASTIVAGQSIEFTVATNSAGFSLSVNPESGSDYAINGNEIAFTPKAYGAHKVTATATADTTKSATATLIVVHPPNIPVHKILMVFPTEIQAAMPGVNGGTVEINHKMSEAEKKAYEIISSNFSNHLNNTFFELVKFEIDAYFTIQILKNENLFKEGNEYWFLAIPDLLPEIIDVVDKYHNVMTVSNLGIDYIKQSNVGGFGREKYGVISFNEIVYRYEPPQTLEKIITDESHYMWDHISNVLTHEFIHTIERQIPGFFPIHSWENFALSEFGLMMREADQAYLLNQAIINGNTVGIPFSYWGGSTMVLPPRSVETIPSCLDRFLNLDMKK